MESTTYIAEITNQKNEKYLSEGRNPLACLPPRLLSDKKFCRFWAIKLRDLSHVVSVAPIFLGIFFHHSFYGTALKF